MSCPSRRPTSGPDRRRARCRRCRRHRRARRSPRPRRSRRTRPRSRTSPTTTRLAPPSSVISAAVADAAPSSRSAHTTAAPSRAHCTAIARPLPTGASGSSLGWVPAPTTSTRLPSSKPSRMVGDRTSAPNRAEQARELGVVGAGFRPVVRRYARATIRRTARRPTRAHARDRLRAVRSRATAGCGSWWRDRASPAGHPSGGSAAAGRTPDRRPAVSGRSPATGRASRPGRCPGGSRDAARLAGRPFGAARAVLRRLRRPTAAGAVDRDGLGVRSTSSANQSVTASSGSNGSAGASASHSCDNTSAPASRIAS